ncbi:MULTISPECIES: hypothetical protein [unclassified Pseudoalteromonas]|jgi:hypothetical protein|uniref:hypothetical protein n=1 Tax=unclassified Pseudoalteromonas TaxID=194690 RepID=UPI001600D129|nr:MULTISPECIES: hypothetical protein [unclassified Pseudoalteromonas]MBB1351241.1 hypothetical protein [Pseudoalteromonas sp. SG45-3]MBB1358657.1 hypothetical protein [Pseudoalteromonas sp. SG45-6]
MKKPSISPAQGFLSSISGMYEAKKDFDKVKEAEKTKRNASDNRTAENIELIKAQKEVLIKQIDNSFELKKAQTGKTFDVIDQALEIGNIQILKAGLDAMTSISEDTSLTKLDEIQSLINKNDIIDI